MTRAGRFRRYSSVICSWRPRWEAAPRRASPRARSSRGPRSTTSISCPAPGAVHHRRLKRRLAGSDEWEEFDGTSRRWALLGGAGNIDDNVLELPGGTYRAITLRSYDPATDRWSIWWLDGRNPGVLDPPVVGGFVDGIGTFVGAGHVRGPADPRAVPLVRDHGAAGRWEQAFSDDDGATWEVNWVMDLTRAG